MLGVRFKALDPSVLLPRPIHVDPKEEERKRAYLESFLDLLRESRYVEVVFAPREETTYKRFTGHKLRIVLGKYFHFAPPDFDESQPAPAAWSLNILLHELDHICQGDVVLTQKREQEKQAIEIALDVWRKARARRMYHPGWDKVRAEFDSDEAFIESLDMHSGLNIAQDVIINLNKPLIGESNQFVTVNYMFYALEIVAYKFIKEGYAEIQGVTEEDVERYVVEVLSEFAWSISRPKAFRTYITTIFLMEPGEARQRGGGGLFRTQHQSGGKDHTEDHTRDRTDEWYADAIPEDYWKNVMSDIYRPSRRVRFNKLLRLDDLLS
jgi:hypothetical protein